MTRRQFPRTISRWRPGLAILIALLAFVRVSAGETEPPAIHIQIGGEPSTLDTIHVIDQYGLSILRNVIEGLLKLDPDGKLEKGLAADYEISKDQLTYKFRLRADAKWSDGKPVTIDDCIYGLRKVVDPKSGTPNANELFALKNAEAIFKGQQPLSALGAAKIGDQLVLTLEHRDPSLLMELTSPAMAPKRQDIDQSNKGVWSFRGPTTGDYFIKSYRVAEEIELAPNPYHKKSDQRRIVYHILPEEVTAMNLFESGRMDIISTLTIGEVPRLKTTGLVQSYPSTTVFYVGFNMSKPPFNDPVWRKAIAAVVNRKDIVRALRNTVEPETNLIPPALDASLSVKDASKFASAIDQVRAIKNKPRVRLAFGSSEFTHIVLEKLQEDVAQKLGLKIELESSDLKTLLGRLNTDPPEMYFLGLSAVYDDPYHHLNAFSVVDGPNYSRFENAEYEKLFAQLRAAPIGPERRDLARRANDLLVEKELVIIPIVLRLQNFGVSKEVKGFHASPYQVIQLNALSK